MDHGAAMEWTQLLASLGVGGALAAFIFWHYKQAMEQRVLEAKEARDIHRETSETLLEVVRENTVAQTRAADAQVQQSSLITALHRRLDRPHHSLLTEEPQR